MVVTRIRELTRQTDFSPVPTEFGPRMVELSGIVVVRPVVEELPVLSETFMLGCLRDGRLRVVEPIEVIRRAEGQEHVFEAPELNEFGFGGNPSDAVEDLQAAIAELFHTLEAEQERLGPNLMSVWCTLSRKVRKVHAADCP